MKYNRLHNNEHTLLDQIAAGDEDAFATLYAEYAPKLQAYVRKFTGSDTEGEEILQESFLAIWLHREKLPTIEHVNAWIYKIVARNCLQWIRRKKSERSKVDPFVQHETILRIPTPTETIQWRELEQAVQTAVSKLPGVKQQIYRINREEGLKPAAISVRLNIPVGTVKNHLSSAIKAIREHLIRLGYPFFLVVLLFTP